MIGRQFNRILILLWAPLWILSCGIDVEIIDKTIRSGSVDFSDANNFEFDNRYVELKGGRIQLKPLDLEHSGDDFNNGTHVGSYLFFYFKIPI